MPKLSYSRTHWMRAQDNREPQKPARSPPPLTTLHAHYNTVVCNTASMLQTLCENDVITGSGRLQMARAARVIL
jgi:hypothetical protein